MIVYREAASLARDLGVDLQTLYALSNSLPAHYRSVEIPKAGGGFRRLTVPDEALKRVQRAILNNLLVYMPLSPYATAYRCGGGAVRNAARHVGQSQVLRLDIRHFFDSVRYSAVKDAVFPPEIFSEPLRVLLTMLCYYRDALPQGAPTSPAIVNILLRDFDLRVGGWCRKRDIVYTRYCDDLTFSGEDLSGVQAVAEAELRARRTAADGDRFGGEQKGKRSPGGTAGCPSGGVLLPPVRCGGPPAVDWQRREPGGVSGPSSGPGGVCAPGGLQLRLGPGGKTVAAGGAPPEEIKKRGTALPSLSFCIVYLRYSFIRHTMADI